MNPIKKALFSKYEKSGSTLDQIRASVIKELPDQIMDVSTNPESPTPSILKWPMIWTGLFWRKIIQPSSGAWGTLSAIWICILGLHLKNHFETAPKTPYSIPDLQTWAKTRNAMNLQLTELMDEKSVLPAPSPPPNHPPISRPRSQLKTSHSA